MLSLGDAASARFKRPQENLDRTFGGEGSRLLLEELLLDPKILKSRDERARTRMHTKGED